MINFLIILLLFVLFVKIFLFWLWLWQIKEYRLDRIRAHFDRQIIRKFLSSFWRIKYPKFTKKISLIFLTGIILALVWFFKLPIFYWTFVLIIFTPLFSFLLILLFQIPTLIWRNYILEKAKIKRKKFKDLLVIGITGSYGKTSTKEFLATILSEKFKVLKTKENQNTEIGISQLILKELNSKYEIFICEMGAYKKGEIALICDIIKPKIGIITGVNEQHLALFGSIENLLSAEGGKELIESLPQAEGMVFLNGKDKFCREIYQEIKIKKYLYGEKAGLLLENIEGARAVAKELMTEEETEEAITKIKDPYPGIKIQKGINNVDIINATYSTNPTAIMAHLDYLENWTTGKKIIIMPCLIELGSAAEKIHQEIGKRINQICDLAIITTKDYFPEIQQGAPNALLIENPKEVFEKIKSFVKIGNIILLEGRSSFTINYLL